MPTLQATYQAARELTAGRDKPSVKLALWAAVLSPNKQLSWNAAQVQALRPYASGKELPDDVASVWSILRQGAPFASRMESENVIRIDQLDRLGTLARLERKPETTEQWYAWRRVCASLRGLSWKTASFAALLLWPLESPLVPVDRHVCARLDQQEYAKRISSKSGPAYERYHALEILVVSEWQAAGCPVPLQVWHWFKWSEWRQWTGDEDVSETPESHLGLSPYRY